VNKHISEKHHKRERLDATSSKGSSVHVKVGSKLAAEEDNRDSMIKLRDQRIKELQEKQRSAKAPEEAEALAQQVKVEKAKVLVLQNSNQQYYHKTGAVPAAVKAQAKADMSKHALLTLKKMLPEGQEVSPASAKAFEHAASKVAPAAVHRAAKKVAELRHKKNTKDKLKREGTAVDGKQDQEVLQAKVGAAEKAAKTVQKHSAKQVASNAEQVASNENHDARNAQDKQEDAKTVKEINMKKSKKAKKATKVAPAAVPQVDESLQNRHRQA